MAYNYRLSKVAIRYLGGLQKADAKRIYSAIEKLTIDPRPQGCKKLRNKPGWRIRIGNFRIIYTIKDDQLLVLIVKIGHRKDVYR